MRKLPLYALLGSVALGAAMPAQAAVVELALALDDSGSISVANFNLQKQGYINALSDLSVLARDGSVAIGIYKFSDNVQTVFAMQEITTANFASMITALTNMTRVGGSTDITGAINLARTVITGNSISSTRQVIDISTDGENNVSSTAQLNAARNAATAAGIQINCLGIGAGADCGAVQAGTGSFSVVANDFGDFEATLKRKIIRETTGAVPEPSTWAMMIAGFGVVGAAMRRRRYNLKVSFV